MNNVNTQIKRSLDLLNNGLDDHYEIMEIKQKNVYGLTRDEVRKLTSILEEVNVWTMVNGEIVFYRNNGGVLLRAEVEKHRIEEIERRLNIFRSEEHDDGEWMSRIEKKLEALINPDVTFVREKRKAIKIAERNGIHYWPIFMPEIYMEGDKEVKQYLHKEVDMKCWKIADEVLSAKFGPYGPKNHGGYDREGHYGWSPYRIIQAWRLAGCGKNIGKFKTIISVGTEFLHRYKKSDTQRDVYLKNKAIRWLERNEFHLSQIHMFGNKTLEVLGKLSYPMRWAAISNLTLEVLDDFAENNRKIRIRDLNWEEVNRLQGKRKFQRLEHTPPRTKWMEIHGLDFINLGLESREAGDPGVMSGKVLKGFFDGVDEMKKEEALPRLALASLFTSIEEVNNHLKRHELTIHDAGQFPILQPLKEKAHWKGLVQRYGVSVHPYIGLFSSLEKDGKKPNTLAKLREEASKYMYTGISEKISKVCYEVRLSQEEAESYQKWLGKNKSNKEVENIPYVRVTGSDISLEGDWLMERMEAGDIRGPLLGHYTNCCQHPGGAGSPCAKHGHMSEDGAFFVVYYRGKIVAQSWTWRVKDKVVFDSIESLGDSYIEGIASLYKEVSKKLIGKLGVKKVGIGKTSYGITRAVVEYIMGGLHNIEVEKDKPKGYSKYMDGDSHYILDLSKI